MNDNVAFVKKYMSILSNNISKLYDAEISTISFGKNGTEYSMRAVLDSMNIFRHKDSKKKLYY